MIFSFLYYYSVKFYTTTTRRGSEDGMRRLTLLALIGCLVTILLGGNKPAYAEEKTASINGEVSYYLITGGSEGADVAAAAQVTLQNEKGNTVATVKTDNAGKYTFPNVAPGTYKVTADYQNYTRDLKTVSVKANQTLKVKLQVYSIIDSAMDSYLKSRNEIHVYINDQIKWFKQPPVLMKGTTLVPMRAIFEELGAKIDWNADAQAVTATKGDITIGIAIGKEDATINGEKVKLTQKAQLINGNTMVPLRFVSEALGATVQWDGVNSEVLITLQSESIANDYKVISELIADSVYTATLFEEDQQISIKRQQSFVFEFRRDASNKQILSSWLSNLDGPTLSLVKKVVNQYTGQEAGDLEQTVSQLISNKTAATVMKAYNGHEVRIELQKIVNSFVLKITF
jgi:hypothetical protein